METETYFAITKAQGFTLDDLKSLTVGFVLDTVEVMIDMKNPKDSKGKGSTSSVVNASQQDFDSF